MATPAPDLVTLRWLALDAIGAGQWAGLRDLLDEEERAKADRFHFERDRQAYIAAHALTRLMLSQRADRRPQDWRFTRGAQGKPTVDDDLLRFNLSHTRGLVAVAVAETADLGVDVEHIDPRRLASDLTEKVFAPTEHIYLQSLPAEARPPAAYDLWTLKESYIKAVGMGLSCPLDAFAFTLDPFGVWFSPGLDETPGLWRFERRCPTPDHRLALAIRSPEPGRCRIDARAVEQAELTPLAEGFLPGGP